MKKEATNLKAESEEKKEPNCDYMLWETDKEKLAAEPDEHCTAHVKGPQNGTHFIYNEENWAECCDAETWAEAASYRSINLLWNVLSKHPTIDSSIPEKIEMFRGIQAERLSTWKRAFNWSTGRGKNKKYDMKHLYYLVGTEGMHLPHGPFERAREVVEEKGEVKGDEVGPLLMYYLKWEELADTPYRSTEEVEFIIC